MGHPNRYLDEVSLKENVNERIGEWLITGRIIILKGSFGTLDVMFATWAGAI